MNYFVVGIIWCYNLQTHEDWAALRSLHDGRDKGPALEYSYSNAGRNCHLPALSVDIAFETF